MPPCICSPTERVYKIPPKVVYGPCGEGERLCRMPPRATGTAFGAVLGLMAAFESKCTFLVGVPERDEGPTREWILKGLESTNDADKVAALKRAIVTLAQGEPIPGILMTVIRYCINTDSHELQKLMMLFWEIAEKYDDAGKPLPQLLLIV